MPGPHRRAEPTSGPSDRDGVTDLVRWAAFSCFLVPVALLWYGASFAGAAGTALGLAAVTGVCRLLLRRSERAAARPRARRGGRQAHRGGRHTGENTPVD
ncbi:hypothetical protein OJ963_09350 [Streptomyces sp. RS2]|uniref:hypothetical protein n=1 Tax=Streptomyces sp. RS2 TaxID=1451205 RepID=UPI0021F8B7DC|nr:hypothetical protein [Streptomyces sp. RS2]MCW1094188.1 hypothetical protein [Streptomyces sp. RS2]